MSTSPPPSLLVCDSIECKRDENSLSPSSTSVMIPARSTTGTPTLQSQQSQQSSSLQVKPTPLQMISAIKSGSSAHLVMSKDGTMNIERHQSVSNLHIAALRRLSSSSQPNLFNILQSTHVPTEQVLTAQEMLHQLAGEGDFYEHLWPLESIAEKYKCDINMKQVNDSQGLTTTQAAACLTSFGLNLLTPPPKVPRWLLFLLQFTNILMVLMLFTGLLAFILYAIDQANPQNLYLGVLLYIVVFLTCYETFQQEAKSDQLMEKFRALVPDAASVIRDGVNKPVPASELVPGDIVRLTFGDKIPADCRVIFSQSLKVDQASLTGESEPVDVSVEAKSQVALEARNIVFNGSLVVNGSCLAVVIRTGDGTLIGKMVDLTSDHGKAPSTLQKDIVYFVRVLTVFALMQAVVIFAVGLAKGIDPKLLFINGFVILLIGNVPQGLPTTITACLFIVADRMGKQNVFVKKLDIIESLGSCTCICTDKTGTLTQNLMTVANVWSFNNKQTATEVPQNIKASVAEKGVVSVQLQTLLEIAALNSRVALEMKPTKQDVKVEELTPTGDATELGLYRFCATCIKERIGKEIEEYRSINKKVHEVPFNSSNKWQMSIHSMSEQNGKNVMFVKGAPDVLLSKCSRYMTQDGSIHEIDNEFNNIYTVYEDFGGNGERVLGFAMLPLERTFEESEAADAEFPEKLKERLVGKKDPHNTTRDLIFVGLITLRDPPRDEVPQAIRDCYTAHVRVVMVTGDHPLTAEAIARNIGLITQPTQRSLAKARGVPIEAIAKDDPEIGAVVVRGVEISGSELDGITPMTEDDWKSLLAKKEIVFARTSPENKLTIVKEFTKAGHITAMTGDGVNDSPALKQAAIGVAMGLNGSDVAREAGNIVLLDDNFASIVVGIKEGRLLFANLKKSIAYTLAHLVPEVIPVLLWAFIGFPQPMGSILALCVDLLTDLLSASAFAYEKAESNIMSVSPRDAKRDKLTSFALLFYAYGQAGIILTGGCLFTFFRAFEHYGITPNDIMGMNNAYFPALDDSSLFVASNGRVYDADEQQHIFFVLQGSWFMMMFVGQAAHVWVCRTSTVSLFEHGVFTNQHVNVAVVVALLLGCFVTYTPGLQSIVQSNNPYSLDIFEAALFVSACLWGWSEGRKWCTRNYPSHWLNQYFSW